MPKLFKLDYTPSTGYEWDVKHRLEICEKFVCLRDKTILDVGCGDGKYSRRIKDFSSKIVGLDIEGEAVTLAKRFCSDVVLGDAQYLPFGDSSFDIVLLADIIEHVGDDSAVVRETFRCLKRGGVMIVFAPNRLFPFEVHGIVIGNGSKAWWLESLIPLINYLPLRLRNRFVPHARIYTVSSLLNLFRDLPLEVIHRAYVYPQFERLKSFPAVRRFFTGIFLWLEKSPFKVFGEDHLLILQKV